MSQTNAQFKPADLGMRFDKQGETDFLFVCHILGGFPEPPSNSTEMRVQSRELRIDISSFADLFAVSVDTL